ncbi:glycoside hydrolase family 3 N-terminal domain-containing protein [Actinoplanes sp. NPDC051346]|uniref:glycoside hydrolase family 3 N-terminal domain-containing protein n=1 Tax=Actinoplanes sp. NPDC051346 TaxID=3155048 RepID=UPI00341D1203
MGIDPGLRRLALHTLLAAFAGTSPPAWARELLADGLAGYTLFGANVADRDQAARLTAELRSVRPDVLVATDEEGGDVTRLAHRTGSPYPGNAALGAVDDPDLTRAIYAAIGQELAAAGINLDLAPTVDVNTAEDNPVIGTRSFGANPAHVARHAAAAVHGLQSAGVAACAKHFPGHGATLVDSHLALPTVDVPPEILRERDLPPFAAVIAAGARAIMTAHIRIPALTRTDPATFSAAVLRDLLRRECGFTGAIITDALEMEGAREAAGGIGPAAVRALAAGADLLCIGARVDAGLVERVAAEIVTAVGDGRLDRRRLEDAASRTAELAAWTARRAPTRQPELSSDVTASDSQSSSQSPSQSPDCAALGYVAARRAVRVEGSLADLADPLVVQFVAGHSIPEGRMLWGLSPHLTSTEQVIVEPSDISRERLTAQAGSRPIVVVGRHLHRTEETRALIESLGAHHAVTVVEMGWPSRWRPAGVRAFVTTFGASHANGRAAAEALGLVR